MEDRHAPKNREVQLEDIKRKIRDPRYLQQAVQRIAVNLTREYYQRTQKPAGSS